MLLLKTLKKFSENFEKIYMNEVNFYITENFERVIGIFRENMILGR